MNILKRWYLRIFKGWYQMDYKNLQLVKLGSFAWRKPPQVLRLKAGQYLVGPPQAKPPGACCHFENRNMNGGCDNCGDPCF